MKKITVLIIDDSSLVRQILQEMLASHEQIEVVGTAMDPYQARDLVKKFRPDVITLDVEMPRMDGITFLEKLMNAYPTAVVMISSLTEKNTETTLKALALGAIDFIAKPKSNLMMGMNTLKEEIINKVLVAAQAKILPQKRFFLPVTEKIDIDSYLQVSVPTNFPKTAPIIVMGASTGGTVALETILRQLKPDAPPIAIVQHMPENFTKAFADRVNTNCQILVKEAENNEKMEVGKALIAPGNHHLLLQRRGQNYFVEIKDGPPVNRHRPSVDVLFKSTAYSAGPNAIGIILTGMGDDGAKGLLEMYQAHALTIAQDEASCVVFGMPRVAIELHATSKIAPLTHIPSIINQIK